jgi:hypothetical protein
MGADDRFWNRDQLYQQVWATPMQTLAKTYGISDVGLAKICRKLLIPVPGRGYWARKDAGQKVERTALPAIKEKIALQKPMPRPEPPKPRISRLRKKPLNSNTLSARLAKFSSRVEACLTPSLFRHGLF